MKTKRPIGMIRPLATLFGRARRRWRGGPLVPMIWRRRLRARPAPAQMAVRPAPLAPTYAFNLTLVWPAGTAARAGPMRRMETRTHEVFRAGRGAGPGGTNRLVTLVERLRLRSDKGGPPPARVSPAMIARQPAPESWTQEASIAPSRQGGDAAPPAGTAPRVSPRTKMWGARAATAQSGGAARLQPRAPAIRHGKDARTSKHAERIGKAAAGLSPARTTAAMTWSEAPPLAGTSAAEARRPPRPRTALVWRSGPDSGASLAASSIPTYERRSSTDLVWRRPAAGTDQSEAGAPNRAPAAALKDVEIRVDRPIAAAPPAPTAPSAVAIQPAEMSRLVDEVVRRLDRIGRDERMRRGI